jgi:hypothetical protein
LSEHIHAIDIGWEGRASGRHELSRAYFRFYTELNDHLPPDQQDVANPLTGLNANQRPVEI